jgi:antitoxin component HigA of HigAB toxin-antitoxin module
MPSTTEKITITRAGLVSVADLVVRTEADNERALATVEGLMCRRRTPQEDALLDVLTDQIEKFESRNHAGLRHDPAPHETIRFLVKQNALSQKGPLGFARRKKSHVGNTKRQTEGQQSPSRFAREALQRFAQPLYQFRLVRGITFANVALHATPHYNDPLEPKLRRGVRDWTPGSLTGMLQER